jgi:hypothetical protein
MAHDQESLGHTAAAGGTEVSEPDNEGIGSVWHRPRVTIIAIKRTMLITGSVTDGVSGSL